MSHLHNSVDKIVGKTSFFIAFTALRFALDLFLKVIWPKRPRTYIFSARLSRDLNILSFSTHTPPIRQSHAPTRSTIKSWIRHWLYIAYHCPKGVSSLCIGQGVIIIIFDLLSINVFISMKFWAILKYLFYDFDRSLCSKRRLSGRLSIDVSTTYLSDLLNWRLGQQKAGNY